MSPSSFVARAQRRTRRRAMVVLAVVTGVVGGMTLALVAGASRAGTVVDRYYAPAVTYDISTFGTPLEIDDVLALPGVRGAARATYLGVLATRPDGQPQLVNLMAADGPPWDPVLRVFDGEMPAGSDGGIAVNEAVLDLFDLEIGDELPVQFFRFEDYEAVAEGRPHASGGSTIMRIVALIDSPDDLEAGSASGESIFTNTTAAIVPFEFYTDRVLPGEFGDVATFGYGYDIDLESPDGIDAFKEAMRVASRAAATPDEDAQNEDVDLQFSTPRFGGRRAALEAPANVQRAVLIALAVAAGIAGVVVLALLLAADERLFAAQSGVLGALGMRRRDRVVLALMRAWPAVAVGAALSGAIAIAISGRFPFGTVRRLERDPGVQVNVAVLAVGAVVVAIVAGLIALAVALRATRRHRVVAPRAGRVGQTLAGLSAPPDIVVAGHLAFPARGRQRIVPVWQTIAAGAVSVAAVLAVAQYRGAVDRLVEDRENHGFAWDAVIGNVNFDFPREVLTELRADARFASITEAKYGDALVDRQPTEVLAIAEDGSGASATIVEGRAPRTPSEIALGARVAERLGLGIGDTVPFSISGSELLAASALTYDMTIVGIALPATVFGEADLADAVTVTMDGLIEVGATGDPTLLLVQLAPGVDREATLEELEQRYPLWITTDALPAKIQSLSSGTSLPIAGAAVVAVLGAVLLAYTLATSAKVMRRDLAVLRALGMQTRGVRNSVVFQGLLLAAVMVVIGVPIGLIIGRYAWRTVAEQIGVVADMSMSARWLLIIPLTALVAALAAALPARRARHVRVAEALRAE